MTPLSKSLVLVLFSLALGRAYAQPSEAEATKVWARAYTSPCGSPSKHLMDLRFVYTNPLLESASAVVITYGLEGTLNNAPFNWKNRQQVSMINVSPGRWVFEGTFLANERGQNLFVRAVDFVIQSESTSGQLRIDSGAGYRKVSTPAPSKCVSSEAAIKERPAYTPAAVFWTR